VTPLQLKTTFRPDALGRNAAVVNARGVETAFEWNAADELVTLVAAKDVTEAYSRQQLHLQNQGFQYVTKFFHDELGFTERVEVENRDGNAPELGLTLARTFVRDMLDQVVSEAAQVDATTWLTTSYRYTANELPELVIKPAGNQTKVEWDERHLPFRRTRGFGSTTATPSTVVFNYDLNGGLAEILDAEHRTAGGDPVKTVLARDGFDRVVKTTDALGNHVDTLYDPVSAVVKEQVFGHPAGQPAADKVLLAERRFSRDELSRVFQTDVPLFLAQGTVTHRTFEPHEGALTPADGLVTTRVEWDALSRRTFVVEDDLQTSAWSYDGASRVVEARDPLGNKSETEFDRGSNPVKVRSVELSPEGLVPVETCRVEPVVRPSARRQRRRRALLPHAQVAAPLGQLLRDRRGAPPCDQDLQRAVARRAPWLPEPGAGSSRSRGRHTGRVSVNLCPKNLAQYSRVEVAARRTGGDLNRLGLVVDDEERAHGGDAIFPPTGLPSWRAHQS
jgi:YD repeat-containing protein